MTQTPNQNNLIRLSMYCKHNPKTEICTNCLEDFCNVLIRKAITETQKEMNDERLTFRQRYDEINAFLEAKNKEIAKVREETKKELEAKCRYSNCQRVRVETAKEIFKEIDKLLEDSKIFTCGQMMRAVKEIKARFLDGKG